MKLNEAARTMGRKGGKARAKALSPEERTLSAQNAACVRWGRELDEEYRERLERDEEQEERAAGLALVAARKARKGGAKC